VPHRLAPLVITPIGNTLRAVATFRDIDDTLRSHHHEYQNGVIVGTGRRPSWESRWRAILKDRLATSIRATRDVNPRRD
jgi:hypothetical protein